MENNAKVKKEIESYIEELHACIDKIDKKKIAEIIELFYEAYKKGNRIFFLGNGGSASTSSHFACDIGKGTLMNVYDSNEKRFNVMSLTDNVSTITAYANDVSYDDIFLYQLHNHLKPGDIVVGISGSGNSENVVRAVKYANTKRAITVGFLGFRHGGKLKDMCRYKITIQSDNYGIIEDLHLMLDHVITRCLARLKREELLP